MFCSTATSILRNLKLQPIVFSKPTLLGGNFSQVHEACGLYGSGSRLGFVWKQLGGMKKKKAVFVGAHGGCFLFLGW